MCVQTQGHEVHKDRCQSHKYHAQLHQIMCIRFRSLINQPSLALDVLSAEMGYETMLKHVLGWD